MTHDHTPKTTDTDDGEAQALWAEFFAGSRTRTMPEVLRVVCGVLKELTDASPLNDSDHRRVHVALLWCQDVLGPGSRRPKSFEAEALEAGALVPVPEGPDDSLARAAMRTRQQNEGSR
jgi:hypothetical protein